MSDAADVDELTERLEALTRRLDPGERVRLARSIASDVRKEQIARIRENVTPEGEAMKPRKAKPKRKPGRLRDLVNAQKERPKRGRMFRKVARVLRMKATPEGAEVGFTGAASRILRVHQDGLVDAVSRQPNAPTVLYPKRELLGLTPDDRRRILDRVMDQFRPSLL
jgi:phage virion morphogenesis protein